ncbi:MAG: hypothetical protein KC609_16550, partial [Myxococcales bacterium]|nr:hypothetical protein [Myxococcales bacterium]
MARIDGLLNIMLSQGATELHLGCERTPRLLRDGQAQPFHMPELSEEMLRSLLGPLLSDERQATMKDDGRTRFDYVAGRFNFHVELNGRGPGSTGFDVIFRAGGAAPTAIAVEAEPVDPSSAEPQGPPYEDAAGSSQPRPLGAEESSARSSSPGPPEMRAVSGGERSYRAPEHAFV